MQGSSAPSKIRSMKRLDVQDRLEYARCAVAVLRALATSKTTMRYEGFARAIGLISDKDPWEVRYKQQVEAILRIAAAVERQVRGGRNEDIERLQFHRVVTENGNPGAGIMKKSWIETE